MVCKYYVIILNLKNWLDDGVVPEIFLLMVGKSTLDVCY